MGADKDKAPGKGMRRRFGKLTRWIFMVATDLRKLSGLIFTVWDGNAQSANCSATTLADEVGMARQGDGDRVAKQARPIMAKSWRSTRCHIAREFTTTEEGLYESFAWIDLPLTIVVYSHKLSV